MNTKFLTTSLLVVFLSFSAVAQNITKAPAWQAFESFAFSRDDVHLTNSLLVYKDGKIVFERYREGFSATSKQQIWSMTKSITGLIIGKAISENLLKIDDPVQKFYPKAPKGISVSHLLDMVSGYDWNEGYEYSPVGSDVIAMLYTEHYNDMASFAANKRANNEPGTQFMYSSGTSNLLMGILSKSMGPGDYKSYPWRSFFTPLEISNVTWERDHAGTYVASSYLYLSARDLAKIGQLFLNDGKYNNQQIIDAKWLKDSAKPHPYFLEPTRDLRQSESFAYSKHWWLNTALPQVDGSFKSRYPALPANAILALGHWGQMLVILPDQKTIIVRTGQDKGKRMNRDEFFSSFMKAYEQAHP
tara:strand:- start:4067 stop:5143 length:1077 start_codon:yes stop_codon:yes gene_type:complete